MKINSLSVCLFVCVRSKEHRSKEHIFSIFHRRSREGFFDMGNSNLTNVLLPRNPIGRPGTNRNRVRRKRVFL